MYLPCSCAPAENRNRQQVADNGDMQTMQEGQGQEQNKTGASGEPHSWRACSEVPGQPAGLAGLPGARSLSSAHPWVPPRERPELCASLDSRPTPEQGFTHPCMC